MRLRRVHLVNYRRFRDAALEFPDGLIGVVGRNGTGKSTLLEAILWCLFGHEAARTAKDLLKHQGAAAGEDVSVRLEFELDGTAFIVARRLRGKSLQPEASVESAGTALVAAGPNSWDQANAFLARLLGFDRHAFESTVVAKQGELAALSELRPASRKRLLLGMLGVDRVEAVIQSVRSDARVLQGRLDEARRALQGESSLRKELELADLERSQAETELKGTEADLAALRKRHARASADAARLLEGRLRDHELRLRLQALQARLEAVWTQRTRLGAESLILKDREPEAQRLRSEVLADDDVEGALTISEQARVEAERRAVDERRLRGLDEEIGRLRPRADPHAHNGSSPDSLDARIQQLRRVASEDDARRADLRARAEAAHAEERRLADSATVRAPGWDDCTGDDPCPTCGRPLGDALPRLLRLREESRALLRADTERLRGLSARLDEDLGSVDARSQRTALELESTERRLAEVRRRIVESELALGALQRLEAEAQEIRGRLETSAGAAWDSVEHARLLARRNAARGRREALARLEEALGRLPRLRDEDRVLQGQEQTIFQEREASTRELQALGYADGAWERADEEARTVGRRLDALERDRVQWSERLEARSRDTARVRAALSDLAARKAEVETLAADLSVLDALAPARSDAGLLPEFKGHLVGRVRPSLARAASGLLREITGGRYTEIALDDDFGVRLFDGGVAHPLERFSGGEVDVANLSLRLAVSELVANARGRTRLQFVALDEVFGSQDEPRRGAVLQSLAALGNVFRQVLVVTHLEDVRERLEHVVRVEDDGNGSSRFATTWNEKA